MKIVERKEKITPMHRLRSHDSICLESHHTIFVYRFAQTAGEEYE